MASQCFVVPRKNGIYVFGRRYPQDLAARSSQPFRRASLGTRDIAEAKVRKMRADAS